MTMHEQLEQRWPTLSLELQMGNIASEITRADGFQKRGESDLLQSSLDRSNELIELTLNDPRWRGRKKEFTRLSEVMNDWYQGGREYGVPLEWLAQYATQFMYLVR